VKATQRPITPRVEPDDRSQADGAGATTHIHALMKQPEDQRNTREWLVSALHSAVTLELATLPPYLTALWSIKAEKSPVAVSLREVVQEEMQHMSYACNILKAIGERPLIAGQVPEYPAKGLPGGVMPDLVVNIAGLTRESLETFMTIEQPEVDVVTGQTPRVVDQPGKFATIGEFYDEIAKVLGEVNPPISIQGQLNGPRTGQSINDLKSAQKAIGIIKQQGEGGSSTPLDFGPDDLSHYYRFGEVYEGRKLVLVESEPKRWAYAGDAVPFPEVWPVADLPRGGYDLDRVTGAVIHLLDKFDESFTRLVDILQETWDKGDHAAFLRSIEEMFQMQEYALSLMKTPRYDGKGNYVPRWRYVKR
jgi:hypothetical protein